MSTSETSHGNAGTSDPMQRMPAWTILSTTPMGNAPFTFRLALTLGCVLGIAAPVAADHPTAEDVAALRAVVEANLAAQTDGDVKALMATISPLVSGQQRAELEREFREYIELKTDLQFRLLSLDVSTFYSPWRKDPATGRTVARKGGCSAYAEVVQLAVPKGISHLELADYPKDLTSTYRHNSAMLPSAEVVKYSLKFEYDFQARCWKTYKIISAVKPVTRWPANTQDVLRGEEPEVISRTGSSVQKFSGK